MEKDTDLRKPLKHADENKTTEANEEMAKEFEDEKHESDENDLPANRVGGLRGNPS